MLKTSIARPDHHAQTYVDVAKKTAAPLQQHETNGANGRMVTCDGHVLLRGMDNSIISFYFWEL